MFFASRKIGRNLPVQIDARWVDKIMLAIEKQSSLALGQKGLSPRLSRGRSGREMSKRAWRNLWRSSAGSAVVEFAVVMPVFTVMVFGILQYGGYIWTAHSIQQLANDGARIFGLGIAKHMGMAADHFGIEIFHNVIETKEAFF